MVLRGHERGTVMPSVYKVTEIVGTSTRSWEDAAKRAVEMAGKSLRELRIAEVSELDMTVENGKVKTYRAKVKLSFKYDTSPPAAAAPAPKKTATKKKAKRRKTAKRKVAKKKTVRRKKKTARKKRSRRR